MTTKAKFRIPSEKELKDKNDTNLKPSSLFQNYKQSKAKSPVKHGTIDTETQNNSKDAAKSSATLSRQFDSTSSCPTATTVITTSSTVPPSTTLQSTNTTGNPTAAKSVSLNSIIVNFRQRGNPLLKHIRNVPWEYASIIPDYVMGRANCALFLSLRYHQLHPEYLHSRLKELGKGYDLRVLLVQVDITDPHHLLKDLAKICILAELTLILAFSAEEAGRYLEAYKVYENKSAEALMERSEPDYVSKLTECLTTVKSVNKTDSMTLLTTFKCMEGIINASKEDLSHCAGFGPQKAQRLHDVLHEPFLKSKKRHKDEASGDKPTTSPSKKAR